MTHDDLSDKGTGGEALTFDEGVEALADVFTDQDIDLSDDDEPAQTKAGTEPEDEEEADDVEVEEDEDSEEVDTEDEEDEPEDVDQDDSEEDENDPVKATDDLVVELDDGTPITVGELKRNNLFQRDYTKKTVELAEQKKEVEQKAASVSQLEQSLAEMQEVLLGYYQARAPKQPDPRDYEHDPLGYQSALAEYNEYVTEWNAVYQQREEGVKKQQEQQQQQARERVLQEYNALLSKLPKNLQNEKELDQFFAREIAGASEHYGFTREEISSAMVQDHRMILALRDANAYRRLKKKAPDVQKKMSAKPKLVKSSKRPDPKTQQRRAKSAKSAELRRTGDFDAGVKAIEDLL